MKTSAHRNRLANETSPYLQQHASNPVDWYPWGEEALSLALREQKPILLSVGYSACHWCHVMAHESFEDERTAALMNAHFVNIKVDREERPDVDQLYQGVVQLMGLGGGWPLTVFLTPDLRPYYGGTYFPPTRRHGLPAFSMLLERLSEAWVQERDEVTMQAKQFEEGLRSLGAYGLEGSERTQWSEADIVAAAQSVARKVDPVHGGFGSSGPKFPNPMNVALLLRGYRRTGQKSLLDAALLTLEKMALGGIFDHLGGGFHRYSVDERWLVPHFEKMLYDNAQLIHLYAEAMLVAPRPLWQRVVEQTVAYVEREMTSPQGGFFAAQDADSEGEEGKFFVWKPAEVEALLGAADARLFCAAYGVTPEGNFEHGATVLEVVTDSATLAQRETTSVADVEGRLAAARKTLFEARRQRVAPGLDDKILTGWNGLMIRGLAFASRVFRRPDWATLASRAADFVLQQTLRGDGSLARSVQRGAARFEGVLEDAGDLAAGLTGLYQATSNAKYLAAAEQIADRAWELHWDEARTAYLAARKGQVDLLVPTYALHDNAVPSGASSLTEAQVALAALTGHTRHFDRAGHYLERLHAEMLQTPMGYGHALLAADAYVDGAAEVTIVGAPAQTAVLRAVVDSRFVPTVSVNCVDGTLPVPAVLSELMEGRAGHADATAYLCRDHACSLPLRDLAALEEALRPLAPRVR